MTNDKIELPKELKEQKPAVKVGAEILPLEGSRAGQLSLNGGDETWWSAGMPGMLVAAKLDKPTERDGIHRHGSYTQSWAVVNGPVKPGDKVIALEFAFPDMNAELKKIGAVYTVHDYWTGSGSLWVTRPDSIEQMKVSKWAKLESKNSHVPAVGDKPARSESNTPEKGDVVRILKPYSEEYGLRPGMLATVGHASIYGGVDAQLDGKAAGGAPAGGYEFPVVLRKGDRVEVTSAVNSQWAGEGVIERVGFGSGSVLMKTGRYAGSSGEFLLSELKPLESKVEEKKPELLPVGTRVIVDFAAHMSSLTGKAGIIVRHQAVDYESHGVHRYSVHMDQGGRLDVRDLHAEPKPEPKPKFKVGDKVRVVHDRYSNEEWLGKTGTITELYNEMNPELGQYYQTSISWCGHFEKHLELVTDSPVRKVKVNAVKDADGDMWVSSNKLFGDKLWHWVGNDVGFGAKTFEQLEKDHGPLTAVTE
jgi:hypothetical protein